MGGYGRQETDGWEAQRQYRSKPSSLPPKKRPRSPDETDKCLGSSWVAKCTPLDLSRPRPPSTNQARRRSPDWPPPRDVIRDQHVRWSVSSASDQGLRQAGDDQQQEERDGSPVSTTTSTSLSTDDGMASYHSCSPRLPAFLSEDLHLQHRQSQQGRPRVDSLWPLACGLAYCHLQSINNDQARPTDPTIANIDEPTCLDATSDQYQNRTLLLSLLQGPSGLCIPDVVNPTQAATWFQSTTAFLPDSSTNVIDYSRLTTTGLISACTPPEPGLNPCFQQPAASV